MNKETILQKAQNEKDERENLITIKAHKLAGNISLTVAALIALALVADGYLGSGADRSYDFLSVAAILMGVTSLNNLIFAIYQYVELKTKKSIADIAVFGAVVIWAIVTVCKSFVG